MKTIKITLMPLFFCLFVFAFNACSDDEDTTPEICNNGIDDDADGDIDCADSDCATDCIEICDNGIDDDGDGAIDCADSDCVGTADCLEICNNGIDDDLDGLTDCDDSECNTAAGCFEICDNGIDDDSDGAIDCADSECAAASGCFEECNNAVDDDGNGDIDCFDDGCATFSEAIFTATWVGRYQVANGLLPFLQDDTLVITSGVSTTDNIVTVTSQTLFLSVNATITSCGTLDLENGIVIPAIPVGTFQQDTIYNVQLGNSSLITINPDIQTVFLNFQGVVIGNGSTPVPGFPYPISGVEIESTVAGSTRQ
jgi:hypothetical protein